MLTIDESVRIMSGCTFRPFTGCWGDSDTGGIPLVSGESEGYLVVMTTLGVVIDLDGEVVFDSRKGA